MVPEDDEPEDDEPEDDEPEDDEPEDDEPEDDEREDDDPDDTETESVERALGRPDRPRYAIAAWLYGRALGLVLCIAFLSIWAQLDGLIGDRGITPAAEFLERLEAHADLGFFDYPSLVWLDWFGADTAGLSTICGLGTFASFLLLIGVLPKPTVLVAWACYLSIVNVGFPFTAFQWDILLLEVSLASVFVLPWRAFDRPDADHEPLAPARWLLYFLLFRLMFRSGWVKLASDDPTWADLTALTFHYETQPLPTAFGWWAHQLPDWIQVLSCGLMFGIELVVPFLLVLPFRHVRRGVAAAFVLLMMLILIAGNYGFFNLLAIALCLLLVDDAAWRRLMRGRLSALVERLRSGSFTRPVWVLGVRSVGPALFALLGLIVFTTGLGSGADPLSGISGFRSFNDYGLFAIMTTSRPEITIEGSADGREWHPYDHPYKPGALDRAPVWNTPHQPRLDWQMWFAALGDYRRNPWLVRTMQRLLEGEPTVLELFEHNPFPDEPPRYVRATIAEYHFTTLDERSESGNWWTRGEARPYTPVLAR